MLKAYDNNSCGYLEVKSRFKVKQIVIYYRLPPFPAA